MKSTQLNKKEWISYDGRKHESKTSWNQKSEVSIGSKNYELIQSENIAPNNMPKIYVCKILTSNNIY